MSLIHYSLCPVCKSSAIDPLLTVKDHSVSHQEFVVWQCRDCSLRFTQDVPDQESIGPYYQSEDYISHSNTSKGALNKLYQRVRRFTLKQKADLVISHTRPRGSILDMGAGIGAFLDVMKEKSWNITGLEPDAGAREQARKLFRIELQDAGKLEQLQEGSYDAITLWHVLEHVHALHNTIEKLKKLLTTSGKLFIAVPNYSSLDASVYLNFWAAYDVPRHLYHFTPKSIDKLMALHGMRVISKKPMWFDSFYISLLSSKYHRGKTSWIGAGVTGLRSNIKAFLNKDRCSSVTYIIEKA
ncbi:MAG TPA: class I SAM-dependent methyltransferase [Flavisolibacter sp.]|jgi:2-polyprenyl-3-methyl-5-hydroxy-6-metoxy-1,4-benzoquinol methylase|nr:class I SAM-dependent methyltransferase [Flavisolibacter sp.]